MDPSVAMGEVETCVSLLERYSKRFWGMAKTIAPIAVLAAPRVDYFAESIARRQAREERVAEAEAAQEAFRIAASTEMKKSPLSSSEPSPPLLTRTASNSSSTRHLPTPSNIPGGDRSNFSESPNPTSPAGDFNLDFGGGGDAIFGAMFPDFFADGNDPSMVRSISFSECFLSLCSLKLAYSRSLPRRSLQQTLFPGPPAFSAQPQPPPSQQQPYYPSYSSYSQPPILNPILTNASNPGLVVSDYGLASPSAWGGSSQHSYQQHQQQLGGYGSGNGNGGGWQHQQQRGGGGGGGGGGAGPSSRP
ncbi:hypothetical protein BDY24DRAFT_213431 [Mrakia frigida]|uniref:uncharacterized protein n=1 Tax=Mrakia frigida TaxID=29902 RepID=UPI003FCC1EA1